MKNVGLASGYPLVLVCFSPSGSSVEKLEQLGISWIKFEQLELTEEEREFFWFEACGVLKG